MTDPTLRSEWINDSGGTVGVTLFDDDGKRIGGVVKPGATVWLTEKERIATANAPAKASDNPFANGTFRCVTPSTEMANRREFGAEQAPDGQPIVPQADPTTMVKIAPGVVVPMTAEQKEAFDRDREQKAKPTEVVPPIPDEVGAPPLPEGDPERGVRKPGEEVGTPQVVKQSGTQARKAPSGRGVTVDSSNPLKTATPEGPTAVTMTQTGPKLVEAK